MPTVGSIDVWVIFIEGVEFVGHNIVYDGDPRMGDVKKAKIVLSGKYVTEDSCWLTRTRRCDRRRYQQQCIVTGAVASIWP